MECHCPVFEFIFFVLCSKQLSQSYYDHVYNGLKNDIDKTYKDYKDLQISLPLNP